MIIVRRHPERSYLRRVVRLGATTRLLLWTSDRSAAVDLDANEAADLLAWLRWSRLARDGEYEETNA